MKNRDAAIEKLIQAALEKLTDKELEALNVCIQLGTDPRKSTGYEKASTLFTDRSMYGVPLAHDLTKQYVAAIVFKRLKG